MKQTIDINDLESIIDEWQDSLFSFAFFRVGSYDVAQDVVQDVLVRLYTHPPRPRPTNLKAYLLRMVYNACADFHRREQRLATVDIRLAANVVSDEEAEARSERERIDNLLAILPAEQATIVKMHFVDDLSFVDIAEILALSQNTVKSRYRYAIDKMRKQYKNMDFEEE